MWCFSSTLPRRCWNDKVFMSVIVQISYCVHRLYFHNQIQTIFIINWRNAGSKWKSGSVRLPLKLISDGTIIIWNFLYWYVESDCQFLAVFEEENITVRTIRLITDDEINLYQQFIDIFKTIAIIECRLCRVHWDRSLRKWLDNKHKLKYLK